MSPNVKLTSSGKVAMDAVSRVLITATPSIVPSMRGPIEMRPGTIWNGNKMLVLVQGMTTYFTIDDRLYETNTSSFIAGEWLAAYQGAARGAKGWVVIAQVQMALLCGIFVPWYLMLGLSCAKVGLFYAGNQGTVDKAFSTAPKVLEAILKMRSKQPTLFRKLCQGVTKELLSELRQGHGVTPQDVAFFVGRVIKGAAAAPELTLFTFLKIVVTVGTIVTATHAPAIVAHAAQIAIEKRAEELRLQMHRAGYTVTSEEAKEILREVTRDPDGLKNMKQLETALQALIPSLDALSKAYGADF